MRIPATIHATDIHSPPQTIHSTLSKKDKADILILSDFGTTALKSGAPRDLSIERPVRQQASAMSALPLNADIHW
jgi:hypothetical protein